MGMFDYIYSRNPQPECDLPSETGFQTKDLDCCLEHYVIAADGRLLRCASIADAPLDLADPVDTAYHGDLRFYGHGPDGTWYEFVARFTDGTLDGVRRDADAERAQRARRHRAQTSRD